MQNTTTKKSKNIMNMFSGKQILIPIAALLLLAVFNLIADPSFYKIPWTSTVPETMYYPDI